MRLDRLRGRIENILVCHAGQKWFKSGPKMVKKAKLYENLVEAKLYENLVKAKLYGNLVKAKLYEK